MANIDFHLMEKKKIAISDTIFNELETLSTYELTQRLHSMEREKQKIRDILTERLNRIDEERDELYVKMWSSKEELLNPDNKKKEMELHSQAMEIIVSMP